MSNKFLIAVAKLGPLNHTSGRMGSWMGLKKVVETEGNVADS